MKFSQRKDYIYDPDVFSKADVQTALKIHHEYVVKCSGNPVPKFLEVDRSSDSIDSVWHAPKKGHVTFTRSLDIPAIVTFDKNNWSIARTMRSARQRFRFWLSNLGLQKADYFPFAGDKVFYSGYRLEIVSIEFEQNAYWQQTNVWLGLIACAEIVPDGDFLQIQDQSQVSPAERAESGFQEIPTFSGNRPEKANGPQKEGAIIDAFSQVFASGDPTGPTKK